MTFWSKKKTNKICAYFEEKSISYQIDDSDIVRIKFELCFKENNFIVYPYLTFDEANNLISFNINISSNNYRNYSFDKLNKFNMLSNYFKAYITEKGIVVLEYRFVIPDDLNSTLDLLINSLISLGSEIDAL